MNIYIDLGISGSDDMGRWVGYELVTHGDTLESLEDNAEIFEIDQDGGELRSYTLGNAPSDAYDVALKVIRTQHAKRLYRGIP